jgi:hypothetical protein
MEGTHSRLAHVAQLSVGCGSQVGLVAFDLGDPSVQIPQRALPRLQRVWGEGERGRWRSEGGEASKTQRLFKRGMIIIRA